MSKPRTIIRDRKRWLNWLRANPNLQLVGGTKLTISGAARQLEGRHVCAIEGARRVVGAPELDDPHYYETGRRIGLTHEQVDKVGAMNDGRGVRIHSFPEIADVVEGWPVAASKVS